MFKRRNTMQKNRVASLEFKAHWNSEFGEHTETYFSRKVNLWRDILPEVALKVLSNNGQRNIQLTLTNGTLLTRDENRIIELNRKRFQNMEIEGKRLVPRFGRFYPRGLLKGVKNVFTSNMQPFRCIGVNASNLRANLNHPLAGKKLEIDITVRDIKEKRNEIGGQMTNWLEVLTDGPGMQARWQGQPTDFFTGEPFARPDEGSDLLFYEKPRLVAHVDEQALKHISAIYGKWLKPGMRVLDLMSSVRSHVPDSIELESLVGLGLNAEELNGNPQLTSHVVHDLNTTPEMPFDDCSFDAIICSVSVEYLIRPSEVFEDCARILKPGGVLIHTFSNRWFPPKVTRIWRELSEFERMGLVLEYYLHSGGYENLKTYSIRGWPRPMDDHYYPKVRISDPVYAVAGRVKTV